MLFYRKLFISWTDHIINQLLSPSDSRHPAAPEEEHDEAEAKESTPQKPADKPDNKEDEYDEDDDEEKATVDVIKPIPEPEVEAPAG